MAGAAILLMAFCLRWPSAWTYWVTNWKSLSVVIMRVLDRTLHNLGFGDLCGGDIGAEQPAAFGGDAVWVVGCDNSDLAERAIFAGERAVRFDGKLRVGCRNTHRIAVHIEKRVVAFVGYGAVVAQGEAAGAGEAIAVRRLHIEVAFAGQGEIELVSGLRNCSLGVVAIGCPGLRKGDLAVAARDCPGWFLREPVCKDQPLSVVSG